MIYYDRDLAMRFPDYGILIPVLDSRAEQIVQALRGQSCKAPILEGRVAAAQKLGVPVESLAINRADLERVHEAAFVARLFGTGSEGEKGLEAELIKTYELIDEDGNYHRYEPALAKRPLKELFETIRNQVGGTYTATLLALQAQEKGGGGGAAQAGFCYYLGGGMHHARYDSGSGFCPINDSAIALARLKAEGRIARAWVIDVDVHKGDGTAELAPRIGGILTLSIHMASGWPLDEASLAAAGKAGRGTELAPFAPSDVEIPIARGEEGLYLEKLSDGLHQLVILSERQWQGKLPDLAIVVNGADPYENDGLPSSADIALSLQQCIERDRSIYRFLQERDIPSAWLMAGGYGERAWEVPAAFLTELLA
ncbi:hypothetical protein MASR2M78_21460 [Treponema sp.]